LKGFIKVCNLKKDILPLIIVIFIVGLVLFSGNALASAQNGIKLWINIVFPSLFSFLVASNLLSKSGIVKRFGKLLEPLMRPFFNVPGSGAFPLAMGITSGYPVGAKLAADLRKENMVTKDEAERLLTFTNNSGPLFVIGAVASGMFNNPNVGIILLTAHIMAGITVGIVFRNYKAGRKSYYIKSAKILKKTANSNKKQDENVGRMLGDAIGNSVWTMLIIGGYIIFFSVLIGLLNETGFLATISRGITFMLQPFGVDESIVKSLLCGFFEVSTGASMASNSSAAQIVQLTTAALIMGWGGLSVHSQVMAITSDTDISLKPYLFGKFLHGVISAIYTYIMLKMFNEVLMFSEPVFKEINRYFLLSQQGLFLASCRYLGLALAILCILSLMGRIISKKA